jgi:hypothetical protein
MPEPSNPRRADRSVELPLLFDACAMRLLLQRAYAAARSNAERRLFASILRRAREDVLELEALYSELPGVFAGDRTAIKSFSRILNEAHASGRAMPPSPTAMRRMSGVIPGFEFRPCDRPLLIGRSRIRLIAHGIGQIAGSDTARAEGYSDTLRGLWSKAQLLESLARAAIEDSPLRNRLAERLRTIARDIERAAPISEPGLPGEQWDGGYGGDPSYPQPDGGPFPWPGPDDGPPITWPPGGPTPGGPDEPPGVPPGVPPGGPPGSGFDPCTFIDDPCNHLAVLPPSVPRSTRWDNITSVSPSTACPGDQVTVLGHSFGTARPPEISLVIGDFVIDDAIVVEWTDTKIVFTVPAAGLPGGCVGFRNSLLENVRIGAVVDLNQYRGTLGACLGTDPVPLPYVVDRPDCSGINAFGGTFPVIHSFLVNGETDHVVEPNVPLVVTAHVDNADTLLLRRDHPNGPEYANVPNTPPLTIITLAGLTGKEPKDHVYHLHAVNRCGTATTTVTVRLRRRPALSVKAIEVIQAIQRCDVTGAPVQEVPLVARHRTIVRVWVDSGLTDDFDYGSGANTISVTGELTLTTVPPVTLVPLHPPQFPLSAGPAAKIDRENFQQSLNFELPWHLLTGNIPMTAKVWATGKWAHTGPGWTTQTTRTAMFHPRRKFRIAVSLVSNKGLPAPSIINTDHLLNCLPIAEDGLEIALVPGVFNNTITLATLADWDQLWSDIAEMSEELVHDYEVLVALFRKHPTDIAGADGSTIFVDSTFDNKAWPPVAVAAIDPAHAATHEIVHCLGIGHAACPPGVPVILFSNAIDPRLWGILEDVGLDPRTREIKEKGESALMGNCPLPGKWPSIKLWELLFQVFA